MRNSGDNLSVLSGRYELGKQLGSGGFGAVYQATDRQLQREVAVKIFDPRQTGSSEELQERFRREAIATAAIQHSNVVTVFDVGMTNDRIFIVMELLQGRPLTKELERWPHGMPATRAIPLLVGALEGLAAGHEAGIVHKDLKPSNLFLDDPGQPKEKLSIIDFGVARVLHERKLTATGKLVGTPRYLAPEYIEDLQVTPSLDVYQMGLITVELLCGMPCLPRRLDLVSCCQRHVDGDLEIPDGLREGEIGAVIAQATHVDSAKRYQTAAEFAAALAKVNPDDVQIRGADGHIPTPRLGVKPLTKPSVNTRPLHGGKAAFSPPRPSKLGTGADKRSTRTGPTKRLGPSKDVAERLQKVEESETSLKSPDDRPAVKLAPMLEFGPPVLEQSADAPDPLAARRRIVYVLLFLALVSASGTAAFFAMQMVRGPATTDSEEPAVNVANPELD